jgi:hypothetical protein
MVLVVLVVLFTFGNAAANMLPSHRATATQLRQAEQRTIVEERRARISELRAAGDHCWPALGHELARLLVMDGQEAATYADDYERRCGADPVVRHWGDAPRPRSDRRRS